MVQMAITGNLQSVWAEYLHGAVFNQCDEDDFGSIVGV